MKFVDWLGRHFYFVAAVLIVIWVGFLVLFLRFVQDHGRFPVGNGELWNWILGL